jgi:hypothetical protein
MMSFSPNPSPPKKIKKSVKLESIFDLKSEKNLRSSSLFGHSKKRIHSKVNKKSIYGKGKFTPTPIWTQNMDG